MPAVLFRERFVEPIRRRIKTQTVRARRYEPGTRLSLRRWTGKPYRSPQEDIIEPVTVAAVFDVLILVAERDSSKVLISVGNGNVLKALDRQTSADFVRCDGFDSPAEMAAYYRGQGITAFSGFVHIWSA